MSRVVAGSFGSVPRRKVVLLIKKPEHDEVLEKFKVPELSITEDLEKNLKRWTREDEIRLYLHHDDLTRDIFEMAGWYHAGICIFDGIGDFVEKVVGFVGGCYMDDPVLTAKVVVGRFVPKSQLQEVANAVSHGLLPEAWSGEEVKKTPEYMAKLDLYLKLLTLSDAHDGISCPNCGFKDQLRFACCDLSVPEAIELLKNFLSEAVK